MKTACFLLCRVWEKAGKEKVLYGAACGRKNGSILSVRNGNSDGVCFGHGFL